MKSSWVFLAVALLAIAASVDARRNHKQTYHLKLWKDVNSGRCEIIESRFGQTHRRADADHKVIMKRYHAAVGEDHEPAEEFGEIIELYGRVPEVVENFAVRDAGCTSLVKSAAPEVAAKDDEIVQIVYSGDPSNRIDIVFMGDGYTAAERDRHFDDMRRLTDDMFASTTFFSHLPLFNIWAIFRESADSGIGVGGRPLDTAYGLYRDGTELRGIYCSKPNAARQVCALTGDDACDFPGLIGNDEFYGGLGGEFTISTRSETTGTIVLRHELGHNLIDVGEEYDGGSVYSGANSARTVADVGWKHWLTEPDNLVAQEATLLAQEYPWYDLADGPYTVRFTSNGQYDRWLLKFSASGVETDGSLEILLDGIPLNWNTTGNLDRGFHEYFGDEGFSNGQHTLVFSQGFPSETGQIRQLCNVVLHEFKNETYFHFDRDYVGAYPTWRQGGSLAGYRPNHERCLMRNMTSVDFCVVCIEEMWLQLLEKISLIDDLVVANSGADTTVSLELIPLGQLRENGPRPGESYQVTWTQNGSVRTDLADKFTFTAATSSLTGSWSVDIQYINPEIRSDPRGYATATDSFVI